jgi:hypothetical protein
LRKKVKTILSLFTISKSLGDQTERERERERERARESELEMREAMESHSLSLLTVLVATVLLRDPVSTVTVISISHWWWQVPTDMATGDKSK